MRFKDKARNIRETGEFSVYICDDAMVDQMEICAIKFGPDVNELEQADLHTAPENLSGTLVSQRLPPLSNAAPEIILGQVIGLRVRRHAFNPANLYIDQLKMDAVGRLGG